MVVGGARAHVKLELDGAGKVDLDGASGFLNHMLHAFARMGGIDIVAKADGGMPSQRAHALGKALGQAIDDALGDRKGIRRYGWASVPMDESLAQVSLDFSGRPYLVMKGQFKDDFIGDLNAQQVMVLIESIVEEAHLTLNATFEGHNDHHKAESLFKAFGLALKDAKKVEGKEVLSTKGLL